MRVAFYAPLKAPDHPVPSGDRTMARLLVDALQRGGHTVELACRLRSFEGTGDRYRQQCLARLGGRLAHALIRRYRLRPPPLRPQLWLTYHLYHKAPDWLGPPVSRALAIPYVVAEASHAPKRETGPWAEGCNAARTALAVADLVLGLNAADRACVLPLLKSTDCWQPLAPFIDPEPARAGVTEAAARRQSLAHSLGFDADTVLLLTVAMMRPGAKLASYRLLAQALTKLTERRWQLLIAGDGPARAEVLAAFAELSPRVHWLGAQAPDALQRLYPVADIYVWPAIGEAYGMAFLEAQAVGVPVVAGLTGGVGDIVRAGETGLLVPVGDAAAFAQAVACLIDNADERRRLGRQAACAVGERHSLDAAARALDRLLTPLLATGKTEG
jgi:glycosyltransferase involved in cell wall biosynthesis